MRRPREVDHTIQFGTDRWHLDQAKLYTERNWGAGFPERWWWGQAHDFGDDDVSNVFRVAFRASARYAPTSPVSLSGWVSG